MNDAGPGAQMDLDELIGELAEEYAQRLRNGEKPDIEEYVRQHPHAADAIRQILPALEIMGAAPGNADSNGDVSAAATQSKALGDFEIVREVGRGGMGVVYEARQLSLNRRVALKVLPFAAVLDERQIQRFRNEALAAAQLDHPHIVDVYGVGCERSVHFYAMRYVEGDTLADLIAELRILRQSDVPRASPRRSESPDDTSPDDGGRTSVLAALSTHRSASGREYFRSVARIGAEVAGALDHAHRQGVIHRDVKPANVIIDSAGKAWVTDFGLARIESSPTLTMTGDLLGTLRYMSPEQAMAKRAVVDHRSDIYALGVTLYELLTLEPAFSGEDRHELLRKIVFEEPTPPRRLNRAVPEELETIVLKAASKSLDERYATAAGMAEDLKRFLDNVPIRARRPSVRQRITKWSRRHQGFVAVTFLCLLLATIGAAAAASLIWRENRKTSQALADRTTALSEKNDAIRQKDAALREKQDALTREQAQAYRHRVGLAAHYFNANDVQRTEKLLAECPESLRQFGWHYLDRLCHSELAEAKHDLDTILDLQVTSQAGGGIMLAGSSGKLAVFDLATLRKRRRGPETAHETWGAAAWHPRGDSLAVLHRTGLSLRRAETLEVMKVFDSNPTKYYGPLCFLPDGRKLAVVGRTQTEVSRLQIEIWDVPRSLLLEAFPLRDFDTRSQLASDHTGDRLYLVVGENQIQIIDLSSEAEGERTVLTGHRVAFHPDGKQMAVAVGTRSTGDVVQILELPERKVIKTISGELGRIGDLAFSPDGTWLVTGGEDRTVRLWDCENARLQAIYRGHGESVMRVAFTPDSRQIVSVGQTELKLWDAARDQRFLSIKTPAMGVDFAPNSRFFASASLNLQVGVWDAETAETKWNKVLAHESSVWDVAISPDSRLIATAGFNGDSTVKIWDAAQGTLLHTLAGHLFGVQAVAFAPGGQLLASAGMDRDIRLWNPQTGELVRKFLGHSRSIAGLAFSPDGRFLASLAGGLYPVHGLTTEGPTPPSDRGQPYEIRLWDVESGAVLFTHNPPLLQAFHPAFSPNGKTLAVPCHDGKVRLYAVPSGRLEKTLSDIGIAHCVAFTPDGKRLAVGWFDGRIGLWDPIAGEKVLDLKGHLRMVSSVAFSGDGRRMVSGSIADGTVKIWNATPRPQPARGSRAR